MGRISTESINKLIYKLDDIILKSQIESFDLDLSELEKTSEEINSLIQKGFLDENSARIVLEKVNKIREILTEKSEEVLKILENKQKEEKLLQEASKLLSDII